MDRLVAARKRIADNSEDENDECCDQCNNEHVIPARLGAMFGGAS